MGTTSKKQIAYRSVIASIFVQLLSVTAASINAAYEYFTKYKKSISSKFISFIYSSYLEKKLDDLHEKRNKGYIVTS